MAVQERLRELGLVLPQVPAPVAAYVPAVMNGVVVYTAGQLPMADGALKAVGKVGGAVDPSDAKDAAALCALNALAAVASVADLDLVAQVLRVGVFVACEPSFTQISSVANGASELIGSVFGTAGAHARSAIGVAALPLDAPVEVELVVALRD